MKKIIFLDRDGVINVDTGYAYKIEDFQFEKNVAEGLGKLQKKGFEFIIVTNQSGIGRGYYSEDDYQKFNDHVVAQLKKNGIQILKSYYSPFHPEGIGKYKKASRCRKPEPGMLEHAEKDFHIDNSRSWIIGDKWADVKCGKNFGIKSILVKTGKGGKSDEKHKTDVAYIAEDLLDTAKFITHQSTS
ncbi:MAG: HAD family hydrolase [Patescibacteria group bacterium]|nr:HAD family hydrolase [Patescibacteria group bacterium]